MISVVYQEEVVAWQVLVGIGIVLQKDDFPVFVIVFVVYEVPTEVVVLRMVVLPFTEVVTGTGTGDLDSETEYEVPVLSSYLVVTMVLVLVNGTGMLVSTSLYVVVVYVEGTWCCC